MHRSRSNLVVPFLGEQYAAGRDLSDLIAPPYDVLSATDRERFADRSPHNIVHLSLPGGGDDRYARAAGVLAAWRDQGVIRRADRQGVTVVAQAFTGPGGESLVRTGAIGAVAVEPFTTGRIRPHERTHAGPKRDRLALLRATGTMFEALLMISRDPSGRLRQALAAVAATDPDATGALDAVQIRSWWVTGPRAEAISTAAGDVLYVADGHHRYETAIAFKGSVPNAARTLAMIVPVGDPGLIVLPTHRVIAGPRADSARLLEGLSKQFGIHDLPSSADAPAALAARRDQGTHAALLLPDRATLLALRPGVALATDDMTPQEVATLDVSRVDRWVVASLEAAVGPNAQRSYTARAEEAVEAVRSGSAAGAVLLNPPVVEDVLRVADARGVMPQKSTYFQPKVPSGMVLLDVTA